MSELAHVLRPLLPVSDERSLVDLSTGDDAAVYRLSEDRAVVVTVDFFTPIVDDPYDFGRIGATNSLSDLYAMGAAPLFALNLVAFPRELIEEGILEEIIRGGADVARTAGIPVLGGHSIDDAEPKYGMVAVGTVHPERILSNAGARPGDLLVLTKPLGTGVIATAHKADRVPESVLADAVRWMTTLNREAAAALEDLGAHAVTDVTGFGLLGHLRSLLRSSQVAAEIEADAVPLIPGALDLVGAGFVPGGTKRNREDLASDLTVDPSVPEALQVLLCDAQTSGGLLVALPESDAARLVATPPVEGKAVIGRVVAGRSGSITVR